MGQNEEMAELLGQLSPEEIASLSDEEMDTLLSAKLETTMQSDPIEGIDLGLLHNTEPDPEPSGMFGNPSASYDPDGEYSEYDEYDDEPDYSDGFDMDSPEDAGITSNPAVHESVGNASATNYDALDDYDDDYGNSDYTAQPEQSQFEPEQSQFEPKRVNHPIDENLGNTFDNSHSSQTPDDNEDEGRDPYDDTVEMDEDASNRSLIEKIKNLPLPVKIGVPVLLCVMLLVMGLLSGGQKNEQSPISNGAQQQPAAAPESSAALAPQENSDSDKPVLLTDYVEHTSAKCVDNPKSKSAGPSRAFSSVATDAWICYRAMGVDGAVMNIVFKQPVTLTEIRLTPGYNLVQKQSGEDKWVQYRPVSRILWRAGGQQFQQEIVPKREEVVYTFKEPVTTESMSLTIQQSLVPDGANVEGAEKGSDDVFTQGTGQEKTDIPPLQDATAIQNLQLYGFPTAGSTGSRGGTSNTANKSTTPSGAVDNASVESAPGNSAPGNSGSGSANTTGQPSVQRPKK